MNDWTEIAAWRKAKRAELIAAREAVADEVRREATASVTRTIEALLAPLAGGVIAFCWPYRHEIDVRFAIRTLREASLTAALPVVVGKGQPLAFREWHPGVTMQNGVLGIPFPVDSPLVTPTAALVPVVGFDGAGYRLGYGGGFFDRTLAALARKPISIGVGYERSRLPTIHPQPHDIAMDFIVTETRVHRVEGAGLIATPIDDAAARVRRLAAQRAL
jgi:5,10-methenyltetrahydrofolate synthetase